ncbi:uncharacterized protein N7487_004269 [Penicillium crustosum]|uniref:uncharacterized protein n=1 Tax=Penicillium crustosum TaxID=36656 RepID=UPI0023963A14|nr:uncharacterized protein N7487_004269 [Penicillium crustosum]KAJ5409910.1 hypothetical protein N7487_004269 [Penicillium crustosum]
MGFFCLGNFIALSGILLVGSTATSGAAVAVVPQANSNGLCYEYVVQAGETCSVIAQAHSITTADIENYNARSWAWPGCGQISQGSFICLSSGEPPMPVALPNAVCGPQVPGTARPNSWSDLGSLNPCAANECCSSLGLCGTTSDFCTSAVHATTALSISTSTHSATPKKTPTSTSTTKSIHQLVASTETSSTSKSKSTSTTKSVPTSKSTTTTEKTTSTHKTTTTTSSTKSTQTKAKPNISTSTSTSTTKSTTINPWLLTMYTKKDCAGDYYILQGHNVGYSKTCVNLRGGLSSKYTETGVSCKWFTNRGKSTSDCDASTFDKPQSWTMEAGLCTVFDTKNCKSSLHSNAYTPDLKAPCQNRGKFDTPTFTSMNCYAEG